jgi:sugar (pentulose or hexulose) kinase
VQAIPGVEGAAMTGATPLGGASARPLRIQVQGEEEAQQARAQPTVFQAVTTSYFRTLGVPLLRGREFLESDQPEGEPVAILNAAAARHYFGDEDPVGEIARATLESVAYQTRDLFEAMAADGTAMPQTVRVDGGMTENGWFLQFLADILGIAVERPPVIDTTALGAAYLAGLQAGLYPPPEDMKRHWRAEARFEPAMAEDERARRYDGWLEAVARTRSR